MMGWRRASQRHPPVATPGPRLFPCAQRGATSNAGFDEEVGQFTQRMQFEP